MKKNKFIFFAYLFITIIVIFAFFSYYKREFSYVKYYENVKQICYDKKKFDDEICEAFVEKNGALNQKMLYDYIVDNNPQKLKKQLDVITVSSSIIQITFFRHMQLFSPLLIIFLITMLFHDEFSSGNFKNYLTRMDYKEYLRKNYLKTILISLITPFSLILILILSCFLTNFNFNTESVYEYLAVYDKWKYNNFLLYESSIILIQFFINFLYVNLGLLSIIKNKNKIVSIVMGYIYFLFAYIIIYVGLYAIILNNIFGFKEMSDFFNISGYWFFNNGPSWLITIPLSMIFAFTSFIILYRKYTNKERVILSYEGKI